MKKALLFVSVLAVVSLTSCKKTCTYAGIDCCTKCTKAEQTACKAAGATCK